MTDAELAALEARMIAAAPIVLEATADAHNAEGEQSDSADPDRTGHIPSQKVTSSSPSEHTVLNRHTVMACKPSGSPAKSSGKPPGAMAGAGCVPCGRFH